MIYSFNCMTLILIIVQLYDSDFNNLIALWVAISLSLRSLRMIPFDHPADQIDQVENEIKDMG